MIKRAIGQTGSWLIMQSFHSDQNTKLLSLPTPGGEPPQRKSRRARGQGGSAGPALRRRVLSLQQQVAALLAGRRAAQRSAQELREANEKMTSQLQSQTQRVQVGKQAVQVAKGDAKWGLFFIFLFVALATLQLSCPYQT